jgi:hypothetical protein
MAKRYFITSVVPGADLSKDFFASIRTFCKKRNAELLLIPTVYTVSKTDQLPEEIRNASCLVTADELRLNSKIRIVNMPVNPAAVDPVTGLTRQSQTDSSFIFGSPKQRLKIVPNGSNVKLPHALMTPGAGTHPYYRDNRNGRIAYADHVIGGLVVEVVNDKEYHFRQVQADSKGAFIDLGVEYSKSGCRRVPTEALVPGDYHAGDHDPAVKAVILELQKKLDPKYLVLHDMFNGRSVNHHERLKKNSRALLGPYSSVEYELNVTFNELKDLSENANKILIVQSNHDLWIDRWIEDGHYTEEGENYLIGHELAMAKYRGEIPFEHGIRALDKKKLLSNVEFLGLGDDFRVTPKKVQLAAHGHQGANGARGSTKTIETTYVHSISGHAHTPEILRNAMVVGTSTRLNLPYNIGGASSWLQTMGVLYYNGSKQLINVIEGKWHG